MVSFLDAPMTTATIPSKGKLTASRSKGRIRKGPFKRESRTIEIDIQPDYEFLGLGLDDLSAPLPLAPRGGSHSSSDNSNAIGDENCIDFEVDTPASRTRQVPDIDAEILYEGITSAPTKQLTSTEAHVRAATKSSSQKGERKKPTNEKQAVLVTKRKTKKSSSNKSSTMPGFIKDDDLDAHIARSQPSSLPQHRTRARVTVRSKSAARLRRRAANSESMYKKSAAVPDSLLDYAKEIHAVERVTPKEEKELGTKTQEAIRLQSLHDELQLKYGRDPTEDEWCAAAGKVNMVSLQEALEDGMRAKNQLVASNLRMVQRVVNLYIRNGLGSEYNAGDLMQDGTMALIRAAEKYEPDRGFRFSTYAMYWIRSAVKRSQTSQSRIVNVPQRIHETHKRVSKEEARLRKELSAERREPTKAELAEACGISVLQLDRCRKAMSQVTFSLDAEVQNHHKPNSASSRKDTMYDIVEGRVDETEYERTQRLLMKEHLIGTLKQYLSPHEVDLLLLRYGLMDERALPRGMSGPLTIAEVSKLVGLKPDKVRRIIINSQKQLRHLMKEWEDFEYELA